MLFKPGLGVFGGQAGERLRQPAADLKMLIVGRISPATAPDRKAMLCKQLDHRLGHSLLSILSIHVSSPSSRTDSKSRARTYDIRVLHGVDVDGSSISVQRDRATPGNPADVECRRVVVSH
jgi:hypothetical protein